MTNIIEINHSDGENVQIQLRKLQLNEVPQMGGKFPTVFSYEEYDQLIREVNRNPSVPKWRIIETDETFTTFPPGIEIALPLILDELSFISTTQEIADAWKINNPSK